MMTINKQEEIQYLERLFKRYVYNLARQKAQARAIGARTRGTQIVGVNSATGGKPIDLR